MDLFRGYSLIIRKRPAWILRQPNSSKIYVSGSLRSSGQSRKRRVRKGELCYVYLQCLLKATRFSSLLEDYSRCCFILYLFLNFVTVRNRVYKCTRLSNSFPSYTRCETWISNSGFFFLCHSGGIPTCVRDQSVYQQVLQATRQRHLRMHFVRSRSFRLDDQIRLGLGMASFLWRHRSERGQTYQRRLSRYVCVCYHRVLFSSFFLHDAWLICICHLFGERRILRIHTRMNIFMGLSWLKALVSHRGPSLQLQKDFSGFLKGYFFFFFLNFGSCSWKWCTVSSFAT